MSKPPNVLENESVEEFDALSSSLQAEFEPTTHTERLLVDMMLHHEWLMRRALRMQQQLGATEAELATADPKHLKLVVRYYRTHERAYSQAKRQLESMRKGKQKNAIQRAKQIVESNNDQRQWEQILKKMPPLSNWVN